MSDIRAALESYVAALPDLASGKIVFDPKAKLRGVKSSDYPLMMLSESKIKECAGTAKTLYLGLSIGE